MYCHVFQNAIQTKYLPLYYEKQAKTAELFTIGNLVCIGRENNVLLDLASISDFDVGILKNN